MLRIDQLPPILELASMNEVHKEETELITQLHKVAQEKNNELTLELLNKLITHTKQHFSSEEKLMLDVDYPDYHSHKHEHMKQLLDLQSILSFYEMTNDTTAVYKYLEDSLTPWIIEHVYNWDIPASEYINQ